MRINYNKDLLCAAIKESTTWREVCEKIKVKPRTGSQTNIKKKAEAFGLDFSHFLGQGWSKGKISPKRKNVIELCRKDTHIKSHDLKLKLIRGGYKESKCEKCGLTEWLGEPIVLELDHINSDHTDNRMENLQVICSNCHSQLTRIRRRLRKIDIRRTPVDRGTRS